MPKTLSAIDAIKADIVHVTQGRDHYQMQLDKLVNALATLEGTSSVNAAKSPSTQRAAKAKVALPSKGSKSSKAEKIPSTGGDFWINLISDQPKSAPEILTAAISQLGIPPTKALKSKLSARMTNALAQLIKSKQIKDSGARGDRRFFK